MGSAPHILEKIIAVDAWEFDSLDFTKKTIANIGRAESVFHMRQLIMSAVQILIYTDGSADSVGWPRVVQTAGWAMVILTVDQCGAQHILGCLGTNIVKDHGFRDLGVAWLSNNAAELQAGLAALIFNDQAQWICMDQCQVYILSDSENALGTVLGERASKSHPVLSAKAHRLRETMLRTWCIVPSHVRAHQGDPFNEATDRAA